jgi:hypothetical protein
VKRDEIQVEIAELKARIQSVENQVSSLEATLRAMDDEPEPRTWLEWLRGDA